MHIPKNDRAFGEGRATTSMAFKDALEGKHTAIETITNLNMSFMGELKTDEKSA